MAASDGDGGDGGANGGRPVELEASPGASTATLAPTIGMYRHEHDKATFLVFSLFVRSRHGRVGMVALR